MIPRHASELSADDLAVLLSPRHPGVRVAGVEVVEAHEVTNSHARLRLTYDEPAGAPEHLFCKLLPNDDRRASVAASGMGLREAWFYDRLASQIDLRVPQVHAVETNDDDEFLILLEDLQTTGCTVSDGTYGVSPDAMAVALEGLATMHVRYADPARRAAEAPWVEPPRRTSDYGVWMLQHGLDHHRDRLRDAFAAIAELYIDDRDALQAVWTQGPQTIIHGDPHLGNVFDDHGTIGFLDWGIMSVNTPLRDVSYFITMALDVEVRRRHEAQLLHEYLDVRAALGGSPIDWNEAWLRHRAHAAYTVPASCQIVLFPDGISEARRVFAESFLEKAQTCVEDLEALDALRQLGV